MLDYFRELLNAERYAPHGYCLLWQPELIWTHVVSDALIGVAYFSIPIALAYFISKRRDVQFGWVVWMFATFIMACGITHFFAIWTLWNPDYGIEALVKAGTAVASVFTAIALWPLIPKAIAIPSQAQLQSANDDLLLRIAERDTALEALRRETDERLRAEEMLRQSQKMEAIGQLSGGIAHDFNNMLTVVLANLDKVKRLAADDPQLQRSIAHATIGAERAAELTDRLLSFARRQPLQAARQDPNEIVAGMQMLLERTLGGQVTLETSLSPDPCPVHVDRNQMENALLNLAVNAQQAMPDGGTLRLATRLVPEDAGPAPGRWVLIEVADTGVGMDPAVRHAPSSRSLPPSLSATAPALASARSMASSRNRRDMWKSTAGSVREPPCVSFSRVQPTRVSFMTAGKPVILFAEDEALLRLVMGDELRDAGFELIEAAGADEAMEILEDGRTIDLLFTDIRMPGKLNGWDLAERARDLLPRIPVIYATGFSDDAVRIVPGGRLFKKPYRAGAIIAAAQELGVIPAG